MSKARQQLKERILYNSPGYAGSVQYLVTYQTSTAQHYIVTPLLFTASSCAIHCSAVQCSAIHCNAVQCNTLQCSVKECSLFLTPLCPWARTLIGLYLLKRNCFAGSSLELTVGYTCRALCLSAVCSEYHFSLMDEYPNIFMASKSNKYLQN